VIEKILYYQISVKTRHFISNVNFNLSFTITRVFYASDSIQFLLPIYTKIFYKLARYAMLCMKIILFSDCLRQLKM